MSISGSESRLRKLSAENIGRSDKFGDKGGTGELIDLFRGADLLDFAVMVHDRHLVGDGERLKLVVGDVDEGRLELVLELDQLDQHPFAQFEVQRRPEAHRGGARRAR